MPHSIISGVCSAQCKACEHREGSGPLAGPLVQVVVVFGKCQGVREAAAVAPDQALTGFRAGGLSLRDPVAAELCWKWK